MLGAPLARPRSGVTCGPTLVPPRVSGGGSTTKPKDSSGCQAGPVVPGDACVGCHLTGGKLPEGSHVPVPGPLGEGSPCDRPGSVAARRPSGYASLQVPGKGSGAEGGFGRVARPIWVQSIHLGEYLGAHPRKGSGHKTTDCPDSCCPFHSTSWPGKEAQQDPVSQPLGPAWGQQTVLALVAGHKRFVSLPGWCRWEPLCFVPLSTLPTSWTLASR